MKKIFIIGPTASGKTELAKFIFDNFKTEIISVDSAQVYQDMNIGSAKPNSSELNSYPHYLIDLIKPTENYSVSQFKKDESEASSNILKNKNVPLLVGGTMLYFNALEYPIDDMPASTDAVRKKVLEELDRFGLNYLYEKLIKIDPECTNGIKSTDKQRVMRALEVYYLSGKPISTFQTKNIVKTPPRKRSKYSEDELKKRMEWARKYAQYKKVKEERVMELEYYKIHNSGRKKIINLIESAWLKPKNIQDGLICDLRLSINRNGRITSVDLIRSSGNIRFDNSALKAVYRVESFNFYNKISSNLYTNNFKKMVITFNPS